jgi:hypothetical protein
MLADEASIDTGKPLPASLFNVEKKGHQMASVSAGKISAVYLSLSLMVKVRVQVRRNRRGRGLQHPLPLEASSPSKSERRQSSAMQGYLLGRC